MPAWRVIEQAEPEFAERVRRLFEAGFNLEARHLLTDWRRIAALAIPGVLVAFAIVQAMLLWLAFSWRIPP